LVNFLGNFLAFLRYNMVITPLETRVDILLLRAFGFTQNEVAEAVGVSIRTVQRWLKRLVAPSFETVF